jgi:hypothetical protein
MLHLRMGHLTAHGRVGSHAYSTVIAIILTRGPPFAPLWAVVVERSKKQVALNISLLNRQYIYVKGDKSKYASVTRPEAGEAWMRILL